MWTQLIQAIEERNQPSLKSLLQENPDIINAKSYQDETLLHFGAHVGSVEIVKELLSRGATPDIPDEFGWTPLHEACAKGNEDIVALFLEKPLNLEGASKNHETALHLATRHGYLRIVARLLMAGANHQSRNIHGDTPLHNAAQSGNVDLMDILQECGADIHARNLMGETPLHVAGKSGNIEICEWCLRHGANPKTLNKNGQTFLDEAIREGQLALIDHFLHVEATSLKEEPVLEAGAEVNKQDNANDPGKPGKPGKLEKPKKPAAMAKGREHSTSPEASSIRLIRTFLFGAPARSEMDMILMIAETWMWFFLFPLFLYLYWAAFAQQIIPTPISIPGGEAAGTPVYFLQLLVNTILVFTVSHLFTATAKKSMSNLHFFRDLRESVHFRVLHLLLVSVFFLENLAFTPAFFLGLLRFWIGFMLLYCCSFVFWWIDIQEQRATQKARVYIMEASSRPEPGRENQVTSFRPEAFQENPVPVHVMESC